jgi:hypothetical protein
MSTLPAGKIVTFYQLAMLPKTLLLRSFYPSEENVKKKTYKSVFQNTPYTTWTYYPQISLSSVILWATLTLLKLMDCF